MLDEQAASISWFGQPLNLTRYEFLLLKTLLHAPGRVFSRQQLMEMVWSDAWKASTAPSTPTSKPCALNCGSLILRWRQSIPSRDGLQPGARLMRIGMRLLLGYFLIVAIAAWFVLSIFVQEVKPGVRRATEGPQRYRHPAGGAGA